MSETELLELGTALARTGDVLRPGSTAPFRDYVSVTLCRRLTGLDGYR